MSRRVDDASDCKLEIVASPLIRIAPLVLGLVAFAWAVLASLIPSTTGRIVAWATIVYVMLYLYVTNARRIVVTDVAVDLELMREKAHIPYSTLDRVTVRASPLGGVLRVKFETRDPPAVIRTRIGLGHDEVLKIAPTFVETLLAHGVTVRVPGRPEVGTGGL